MEGSRQAYSGLQKALDIWRHVIQQIKWLKLSQRLDMALGGDKMNGEKSELQMRKGHLENVCQICLHTTILLFSYGDGHK